MRRKNKKAWLRIVEAFLAVIIILGTVLVIYTGQEGAKPDIAEDIYQKQRAVLDVISKNDSLRQDVLNKNTGPINDIIIKMIPNNWGFAINISEPTKIASANLPNDKDIYVTEVLVTSTLQEYSPKKLRFFVWLK